MSEFRCDACRRPIGARRSHFVSAGRAFCPRCVSTAPAHAVAFPDCVAAWHTVHDHDGLVSASLAAARRLLLKVAS